MQAWQQALFGNFIAYEISCCQVAIFFFNYPFNQGDQGSPLTIMTGDEEEDQVPVLAGIFTFTNTECAEVHTNYRYGYTKIDHFIDQLCTLIGDENPGCPGFDDGGDGGFPFPTFRPSIV